MDSSNPKIWRKKPKQGRSENTASVILIAAEELFAAKGFHHTTSEEIAARAGVGVGSVYDYFPNRTAIALALVEKTALSTAQDSRKFLVEDGVEPVEVSLPKVIRGLYLGYKQNKKILIDLVREVPDLQTSEIYSLDRLIYRASLIYLQMYEDRFPDRQELSAMHAFTILLFTSSVKQYLAHPVPALGEEEFLRRLSGTILDHLLKAHPQTEPVFPVAGQK